MPVILVTGMSGTGKSTVLNALARRGYRVVDTDLGDWITTDANGERLWREDRINKLLASHEQSGAPLFISGTVYNQGKFYPRFSHIVLLSVPVETILTRIASRDTNDFGKSAAEREQIMADTAEVEPLLRASATIEIDTRRPLSEVVVRLAALTGSSSRR